MVTPIDFFEGCYDAEKEMELFSYNDFTASMIQKNAGNHLAYYLYKGPEVLAKKYSLLDKVKDHSNINKSNFVEIYYMAERINELAMQYVEGYSLCVTEFKNDIKLAKPLSKTYFQMQNVEKVENLVSHFGKEISFWKEVSQAMKDIQAVCLTFNSKSE